MLRRDTGVLVNTGSEPRQRFPALDAVRGVAALLVVGFHGARAFGTVLVPGGYLAVDLFFVLSGFVIAHAYDRRMTEGLTAPRFLLMRAIRFWPLYALGLGFGLVHQLLLHATGNAAAMTPAMLLAAVACGLVFVPFWQGLGSNLFPLNIPSWSLLLELLVNGSYAVWLRRLGNPGLGLCVAAAAAGLAAAVALHGSGDFGALFTGLPGAIARTIFSFCLGMLIFRNRPRRPILPLWPILLVVVAALAAPVPAGWRMAFDLAFVLVLSPLLVWAAAACRPGAPAADAVQARLGLLSYPVYAVHRPLLSLATPVVERLHPPVLLAVPGILGGLALFALLLDAWFDQPVRRAIARLLGARPPRQTPEASLP